MAKATRSQVKILVPGSQSMVALLGERDEFLKLVERAFDSHILVRGNEITITGDEPEAERVAQLFEEMIELIERGQQLTATAVGRTIDMIKDDTGVRPTEILTDAILTSRGKRVSPQTVGQKEYVDALRRSTLTFAIGPAGTGKTYLAVATAVRALQAREISRIILTRPAVEAGEKLGFLPGTLYEKIDPYLRPLWDALYEMMDADAFSRLMDRGTIEVAPLAFLRGRSLNDSFIILDEAQNTSPEQMKMFLTRLGFGSKMVVTGDVTQVDLPSGTHSGLRVVQEILTGLHDVHFSWLTSHDVVRHKLVGRIVAAYDAYEADRAETTGAADARDGRRHRR